MKNRAAEPPLYQQIYQDLAHKIETGEIRYMQQLPILPELCRIYDVSDAPVRRALDELAREGFIVKRRGRGQGTFAVRRSAQFNLRVLLLAGFDIYRSSIETCHEVFDLLEGIYMEARSQGGEVLQISSNGFDNLPPAGPDTGYLVIAMSWEEYQSGAKLAERHKAPYVLVNPPRGDLPCVRVDMEQGALIGVRHLLEQGHRRIAFVGRLESEWVQPRFEGYRRALGEYGVEVDPALVRESNGVDPNQDWTALDELTALPDPPTALFAASDYRAIHLLSHCKHRGIAVPGELSLCGYDDIAESAAIEPALTTVRHPRRELGRHAANLLMRRIAGEKVGRLSQKVDPQLVLRASTQPLPDRTS